MKTLIKSTEYQKNIKEGKLLGLLCKVCNTCMLSSQSVCYICGNQDLKIEELQKKGVIITFTVIRIAPIGFKTPYTVAMVKTEDNAHIMGNVIHPNPDKLGVGIIGKSVRIGFQEITESDNPYKGMFSLTFTTFD